MVDEDKTDYGFFVCFKIKKSNIIHDCIETEVKYKTTLVEFMEENQIVNSIFNAMCFAKNKMTPNQKKDYHFFEINDKVIAIKKFRTTKLENMFKGLVEFMPRD